MGGYRGLCVMLLLASKTWPFSSRMSSCPGYVLYPSLCISVLWIQLLLGHCSLLITRLYYIFHVSIQVANAKRRRRRKRKRRKRKKYQERKRKEEHLWWIIEMILPASWQLCPAPQQPLDNWENVQLDFREQEFTDHWFFLC